MSKIFHSKGKILYQKIKIFPHQALMKDIPQNFSRSETLSLLVLIHILRIQKKKRPNIEILRNFGESIRLFWNEKNNTLAIYSIKKNEKNEGEKEKLKWIEKFEKCSKVS